MTPLSVFLSFVLGGLTGTLYGFSFFAKGLKPPSEKETNPQQLRNRRFLFFFLFSSLRILLIGCLWYYILRTQLVSIILVMLSFLTSFWIVIIKRKARQYERF
jgi:ABC-type multidrug transport system permease subunit